VLLIVDGQVGELSAELVVEALVEVLAPTSLLAPERVVPHDPEDHAVQADHQQKEGGFHAVSLPKKSGSCRDRVEVIDKAPRDLT